ncbi:MAG: hypothetical protein C5B53_03345 [Candidatus Melainabacteria bacterium]|nr:MAG: hypothetical protein C5B53_03345 [Candidatus Melainabacteria bacterium]
MINHLHLKQKINHPVTRLTAVLLAIAACYTVSSWQRVQAEPEFDVNGVVTDPQGSGGAGYSSSRNDPNSAVRQSDSFRTGEGPDRAMEKELTPDYTSNQQTSRSNIPLAGAPTTTTQTQFTQLDKVYGGTQPQGLPQTRLDSFVAQAGGQAELIYGDEGVFDIPPYFNFTDDHHINTGIHSGITTGHQDGSLPEAWGFPQ